MPDNENIGENTLYDLGPPGRAEATAPPRMNGPANSGYALAQQRLAQRQGHAAPKPNLHHELINVQLTQPEMARRQRLQQARAQVQEKLDNGEYTPQEAQELEGQIMMPLGQLNGRFARQNELSQELQQEQVMHVAASTHAIQLQNQQANTRAAPHNVFTLPGQTGLRTQFTTNRYGEMMAVPHPEPSTGQQSAGTQTNNPGLALQLWEIGDRIVPPLPSGHTAADFQARNQFLWNFVDQQLANFAQRTGGQSGAMRPGVSESQLHSMALHQIAMTHPHGYVPTNNEISAMIQQLRGSQGGQVGQGQPQTDFLGRPVHMNPQTGQMEVNLQPGFFQPGQVNNAWQFQQQQPGGNPNAPGMPMSDQQGPPAPPGTPRNQPGGGPVGTGGGAYSWLGGGGGGGASSGAGGGGSAGGFQIPHALTGLNQQQQVTLLNDLIAQAQIGRNYHPAVGTPGTQGYHAPSGTPPIFPRPAPNASPEEFAAWQTQSHNWVQERLEQLGGHMQGRNPSAPPAPAVANPGSAIDNLARDVQQSNLSASQRQQAQAHIEWLRTISTTYGTSQLPPSVQAMMTQRTQQLLELINGPTSGPGGYQQQGPPRSAAAGPPPEPVFSSGVGTMPLP